MLTNTRRSHDSLLSVYAANLGNLVSRRRAELALRAAAQEAALASRAKSEFLSNISHELKTPLNAIIGFADIIRTDQKSAPKTAEQAAHIWHAGHRLLQAINDILDISRVELGRLSLERTPHRIDDIVRSCVALIGPAVAEKKHQLTVRVPEDLPLVTVDGARIKQVLLNLLSNACKFTAAGGKIIVLAESRNNQSLTVVVTDTGCGMSAEQIAKALVPFGRIDAGYARAHEGVGLGLPLSRALVAEHGGKFHIVSKPGAGTTVAFTLPVSLSNTVLDRHRAA